VRSSAGKKMLNARAAIQRRQVENVLTHTCNVEKNTEYAASKKETRACNKVTT
jgi:hypothetical protein